MNVIDTSKTEWDLTPLFKEDNDPKIEEKRKIVLKNVRIFAEKWKKKEDYLEKPLVLKEALEDYEKINISGSGDVDGGVSDDQLYFWLKLTNDQNNSELKSKYDKSSEFAIKTGNELKFFTLNLGKTKEDKQKEFLNFSGLLKYRHFLERTFASAKHTLSEKEEKIMNLKSEGSHSKWVRMVSGFVSKGF